MRGTKKMRVRCDKCKRYFMPVQNNLEAKQIIKQGDTYLKSEQATKWSTREYCAFCGKWVK